MTALLIALTIGGLVGMAAAYFGSIVMAVREGTKSDGR